MTKTTAKFGIMGLLKAECRYGENGWQQPAGLYARLDQDDQLGLNYFLPIAGQAPSYNNYCDLDRLLTTMTHAVAGLEKNFAKGQSVALAVKHGNCCGAAYDTSPDEALRHMLIGDLRAVFGGCVMTNFPITTEHALNLRHHQSPNAPRMLSLVAAPYFEPDAIKTLQGKNGKMVLVQNPALATLTVDSLETAPRTRHVRGGFLLQPNYTFVPHLAGAECIGPVKDVGTETIADLAFAWAIGSTSNSNTITLVRNRWMVGNGVGQQDRVGAAALAIKRAHDAGHVVRGAVAYSDSFFPFTDGPITMIQAGVRAIFATSGSVRDSDVKAVCEAHNTTLLMLPDSEARGFFGH